MVEPDDAADAVQEIRPEPSRKVVLLPEVEVVPAMRPDPSRKVWLPLDATFAVPVMRPLPSRNVVLFPEVLAVPAMRPEPSRTSAFLPTSVRSFWHGSAEATTVSAHRARSNVFEVDPEIRARG